MTLLHIFNADSLKKVVRGWGENNDFEEDWMRKLKESHAKRTKLEYETKNQIKLGKKALTESE